MKNNHQTHLKHTCWTTNSLNIQLVNSKTECVWNLKSESVQQLYWANTWPSCHVTLLISLYCPSQQKRAGKHFICCTSRSLISLFCQDRVYSRTIWQEVHLLGREECINGRTGNNRGQFTWLHQHQSPIGAITPLSSLWLVHSSPTSLEAMEHCWANMLTYANKC